MFPIPKYRRIRKEVRQQAVINPLLLFLKRAEKLKKDAVKTVNKNTGIAKNEPGLVKKTINPAKPHRKIAKISRKE